MSLFEWVIGRGGAGKGQGKGLREGGGRCLFVYYEYAYQYAYANSLPVCLQGTLHIPYNNCSCCVEREDEGRVCDGPRFFALSLGMRISISYMAISILCLPSPALFLLPFFDPPSLLHTYSLPSDING